MTDPAAVPALRRHLGRDDPGWPEVLNDLDHLSATPRLSGLWIEGSADLRAPAVAIVGARRASIAGMEVARQIARQLAVCGVTVVSGFAVGIDGAAHEGALHAAGTTVAVLGCGLDCDYPRQHRRLRPRLVASGALLTEYGSGEPPDGWRFPRRNRIIAALAQAVIVVEAAPSSGALSTARWAADLGREVLAVPGSIRGEMNLGSNQLLRDGARPFLDVGDLSDVLPGMGARRTRVDPTPLAALGERLLLDRIGGGAAHPDELSAGLGITPADLAVRLAELELAGVVRRLAGGLVERVRGQQ